MRFAVLALMLTPMPVFAQDMTVDTAVVESCFEKTGPGRIDPACIGDAANACQEQPGGSSTIGISQCLSAEADAWDVILNREYATTKDAYSDVEGLGHTLLTAQRAWIALRDADCDFAYDKAGGGSIRSIYGSSCRMIHTAHRALALRNMREF